jgi:hypothetical protein
MGFIQHPEKIIERSYDELFDEIARYQRGLPEKAMLKVQYAMMGGVLNPIVEDIGDLNHRMNEINTAESRGYEYVKNKVEKSLRLLTSSYGFEKEMKQNIQSNAEYKGISEDKFQHKLDDALENYAQEHFKIKVYNEVQKTAKDAAIFIGKKDFKKVVELLKKIKKWLDEGEKSWIFRVNQID